MAYNTHNSLSPMVFKKAEQGNKQGTRNERWRSKSMEQIVDVTPVTVNNRKKKLRGGTPVDDKCQKPSCSYKELDRLKAISPVVACILPSLAMDFVASSLLAAGAMPLITEDPEDIPKDLNNCKAVVVDVSAPQAMLEGFLEHYREICPDRPFVLVASQCGANNRKKVLVMRILDEVVPTVITGRLGDISVVAQGVIEKNSSPLDSLSSDSEDDIDSSTVPKVVLSKEKKPDLTSGLPPVVRKIRTSKSASPPDKSPSPRSHSPINSPRTSPVPSRGIKKLLKMKNRKDSTRLERTPTGLPIVKMKGQFRETQMADVSVESALEYAQKLCVYSGSFVHLYEANVVTSGELVTEILNTQLGVGNLHSTLPCSAAILGAVIACVDLEDDNKDLSVAHCGHALALYHVAMEEAGGLATEKCAKSLVNPGTLRQFFLDFLHSLASEEIKSKAMIKIHTQGLAK